MDKILPFMKLASFYPKRYELKLPETMLNEEIVVMLTPKEAVIVTYLINGHRAKEIAWELKTSLHTVNTHLGNIKSKFKCSSIFQLGLVLGSCVK